jgi:peptidyl-prolyl cis-trans isomerase A (cyclophilin A)
MAQFGISGNSQMQKSWGGKAIKDDPVTRSNTRGTITFATSGKDTRSTQLFINFGNNAFLDKQGYSCFFQDFKHLYNILSNFIIIIIIIIFI